MADDELPKDYCRVYCEDSIKPPLPPMRRTNSTHQSNTMLPLHQNHHVQQQQHPPPPPHPKQAIRSDGAKACRQNSESTVDLRAVVAKLTSLSHENNRAYAMNTLNEHFSTVFNNRKSGYKAYIQYFEEKDTYVVRVESNTLRAVRDKLPKRGNYRHFFKQSDNTYEEVDSDESSVPFHEKEGLRQIYCQVFPC